MHKRISEKDKEEAVYTTAEVSKHNSENDCWVSLNENVYDVTAFLEKHPGGVDVILSHAGEDIKDILNDDHVHAHSANAYSLLREYKIGKIEGCSKQKICAEKKIDEFYSLDGYEEDLINWNRGLVFQVHKLGSDYMTWVNSPVNRKLKLFDSNFIEFFSKTPWFIVPLIWIPFTIFYSVISMKELHSTLSGRFGGYDDAVLYTTCSFIFCFCFAMGIPTWTFVEYMLHRYLFHLDPKGDSPLLITFHFFLHGQHHKVPFDNKRLVFPPVGAAVFAAFFLKLMTTCFPGGFGRALFAGGLLGYVIYDLLHYYFHHGSPARGSYLHEMKYYHVLHHYDDHSSGYGISTRFWDYPFKTVNKKVN